MAPGRFLVLSLIHQKWPSTLLFISWVYTVNNQCKSTKQLCKTLKSLTLSAKSAILLSKPLIIESLHNLQNDLKMISKWPRNWPENDLQKWLFEICVYTVNYQGYLRNSFKSTPSRVYTNQFKNNLKMHSKLYNFYVERSILKIHQKSRIYCKIPG